MKPNEEPQWLDRAVGESVAATKSAREAAIKSAARYPVIAGLVEQLASEVMTGSDESGLTVQATNHAAVMAAGVWHEWNSIRPMLKRYRLLLGGGGFSVCCLLSADCLVGVACSGDGGGSTPEF